MDKAKYMRIDKEIASIVPLPDGGAQVTKSPLYSIADFLQDGTPITKEEYEKLEAEGH